MKWRLRILIVEDDKYYLLHLREVLAPFGVVEGVTDFTAACALLQANRYDLVITDLHLPEGPEGLKVLDAARAQGALRLMLTSSQDEGLISEAYARGAQHVLAKSQVREHLPAFIKSLVSSSDEIALESVFERRFPTQNLELKARIKRLLTAPWHGRSLLITGPTGTGKSVLGKVLAEHLVGEAAPFVHLNCSEIPDNLLESELFGHEKGAFTGADRQKLGKLKAADGGVLFLDEVGTMSPQMQQKLLKALEEKTFYPVGSNAPVKSSFILITATCEDLQSKIAQQLFREDLYFRIAGLTLHLAALRDRPEDILPYFRYFQELQPRRFVVAPEALAQLATHSWPGNLRELKQFVLAVGDLSKGVVGAEDVRSLLSAKATGSTGPGVGTINDDIRAYVLAHGLRSYFQLVEREMVRDSVRRHSGKITACIRELQISSSAFYRILQEEQLGH